MAMKIISERNLFSKLQEKSHEGFHFVAKKQDALTVSTSKLTFTTALPTNETMADRKTK